MKDCQTLMAALSENMVTVNVLLSVFFLPGLVAGCTSHLHIRAPKEMETLSGSCLHIPCTFKAFDGEAVFNNKTEIIGRWFRTDHSKETNVVFDSSKSINIYPMNITGILKKNNCTTLFSDLNTSHQDTYYFRIVNGPFMATATCEHVQIKVKDSAQEPNVTISGDLTNLKEHQSVTVTCSAFTPCPHSPPELTWNLQQDSLRQTERNTDGTFTTKIQENITLSDTHDGYNITCSARYPVKGGNKKAETQVTLSVSSGNVSFWTALPVSISVILLVCLVICVWWFKFKHPSAQQTQTQTEMEVQTPDKKPDEEIHYGEVNFLQRKPAASTVSVEDRGQQETVYAPVRVSAGH